MGAVLDSLRGERWLVALLGPSGSGKSSLMQAGVLPALAEGRLPGGDRWGSITARPGADPHPRLEAAGLTGAGTGLVAAARRWVAAHPGHDLLVLVLDQFEELLVATPEPLRELADLYEEEPSATVRWSCGTTSTAA